MARRAHGRRVGLPRLRGHHLVRHRRSGRHARPDHRPPRRGNRQGARRSRREGAPQRQGRRRARRPSRRSSSPTTTSGRAWSRKPASRRSEATSREIPEAARHEDRASSTTGTSSPGCCSSPSAPAASPSRSSYPFGSVQQMGPGFFPRVLGVILVGLRRRDDDPRPALGRAACRAAGAGSRSPCSPRPSSPSAGSWSTWA